VPLFLQYIEAGHTITAAAACSGLSPFTVYKWLDAGRENADEPAVQFLHRFTRARGIAQKAAVDKLRELATEGDRRDWRGIAWLLERQHPDDFNLKTQLEISGNVKTAVEITLVRGPEQAIDIEALKPRRLEQ
jgi:hypothetical protein